MASSVMNNKPVYSTPTPTPTPDPTTTSYPTHRESRPWGVYLTPGGVGYVIYDFAAHMNYLRMEDIHYLPNSVEGGAPDGNHYGVVPMPEDLKGNEGLVIGKQGKNLKAVTSKTGVIGIWYDSVSREIQICAGNSRYTPPIEPTLPGHFAETGEMITEDGMDNDILGFDLICETKFLIHGLIQNARRIVANNARNA